MMGFKKIIVKTVKNSFNWSIKSIKNRKLNEPVASVVEINAIDKKQTTKTNLINNMDDNEIILFSI